MELGLRGKVAIVTGGSMGIGKACVEALSGQGVRVATCARGIDALEKLAEEVSSKTETEVFALRADVTNADDVKRFVAAAYHRFGRLDILVNNAANFASGDFWERTDEDVWHHFNTKLLGYVRFVREALPRLREQKQGSRIINMAGAAARSAGTSGAPNSAIINFTKVLSDEVAKDGITVNAIHPVTRGLGRGGEERDGAYTRLVEHASRRGVPLEQAVAENIRNMEGRTGFHADSSDTANMVLFLSSDKASAITGQTLWASGSLSTAVYY